MFYKNYKKLLHTRAILWIVLAILVLALVFSRLQAWRGKQTKEEVLPKGSLIAEEYYQKALLAKGENKPKQVRENIIPAYKSDTKNATFLEIYGWAEYNLGNYDEAIKIYSELVAINHSAAYYNYLGNAYRDAGNTREAVRSFQAAIKKNYHFKTAYQNLINVYRGQNWMNRKDLITFLKQVVSGTDNNTLAREYLEEALRT